MQKYKVALLKTIFFLCAVNRQENKEKPSEKLILSASRQTSPDRENKFACRFTDGFSLRVSSQGYPSRQVLKSVRNRQDK
jgi:hypothetical protein